MKLLEQAEAALAGLLTIPAADASELHRLAGPVGPMSAQALRWEHCLVGETSGKRLYPADVPDIAARRVATTPEGERWRVIASRWKAAYASAEEAVSAHVARGDFESEAADARHGR
jgi:hypothetical protein